MKLFKGTPLVPTLSVIALLTACAGGGETGTGLAPVAETDVSVGVITAFGSVYVNGIKFETTQSAFTIDDIAGSENDLKVGMLVKVSGEIDSATNGRAARIEFAKDVEGPVTNVSNLSNNQFEVLGQEVNFNIDTVFESKTASVLAVDNILTGNVVEVSGYADGTGVIYATRIEVKRDSYTSGEEIEIKGIVSNLDTVALTFQIGSQLIYYNGIGMSFNLADGQYVEVKSTQGITGSQLIASEIELEGDGSNKISFDEGKELELEGLISNYDAGTATFSLYGQNVQFSASTQLNGVNLADGVKIEVHGTINQSGVLIADEIEGRIVSNTKFSGLIESIVNTNDTKTITLLGGKIISINSLTALEDDRDGIDEVTRKYFNFNDLTVGQYVEVVVYYDGTTMIATRLELDDDPNGSTDGTGSDSGGSSDSGSQIVELEGSIDNITNSSISVSGIEISVSDTGLLSSLQQGQYVDVDAEYTADVSGGSTLTLVQLNLEMEGRIEQLSDTSINVAGTIFTVTDPSLVNGFQVNDYVDVHAGYDSTAGGFILSEISPESL